MESNAGRQPFEKEIYEEITNDTTHRVESTRTNGSNPADVPPREATPWPENGYENNLKKSMEDEMKDGVESIMIPVESTKLPPILEHGTPGSSVYPEAPTTVNCPNENKNISSIESSSEVICTTTTTSPDLNPLSPLALPPKLPMLQDQKMESKDTTTIKRKRKSPSVGLPSQKPKKPKIIAEPKKTPACKSCYHKHIGCDRLTENEPCRACEKRKQPCERNDVRVVKGEKMVVKEELTAGESSHKAQKTYQKSPVEGGVVTPSSIRTVSVAEAYGEEDQNSCGEEVEGDVPLCVPSQNQERGGNKQVETHVSGSGSGSGSGIEERVEVKGNQYAVMTEAEKEVVNILMGMKSAKVKLLDETTSHCYFEAIKGILMEGVEDSESRKAGLKMLEKLKWQFTWLSGYSDEYAVFQPLCD
ncbi:uncharacterized protein DFL_001520 [Arthrobotrys flagrans]|uniref:Zn(2)-C6 fungal-type domain-containing protein n=1 Tax=Arthrobotrys flagrans TaxID=97331 RepID=A0A437A815_ARTFL|nr:hypothetical protein DFL_001520 [Arthrobotrys flagrans]